MAGIGYVADLQRWSAFAGMDGIEVVPLAESDVALIEQIAFRVKQGQDREANVQNLKAILSKPDEGRAKSKRPLPMLLALTELSIILRDSKLWSDRMSTESRFGERRVIDTLAVYSQAIAAEFLGVPFPLAGDVAK